MGEKIIKIYYETFLEEEYDFNGIILTPHLNREEDRNGKRIIIDY